MPNIEAMKDAQSNNADLDAGLRSAGIVDRALYLRLKDAESYGAATSMNWVDARMQVLLERVRQGKELSLFNPSLGAQTQITGETGFRTWVREHFPHIKA